MIDFAIAGDGVQMIAPLSPLPAITASVLIDGTSQTGYTGTPLIQIDGTQAGGGDGLMITSPDVTVRGLDVSNFSQGAGIHLTGPGAVGDWVYGNFLGTDPTGAQAEPNNVGVQIDAGASETLVGTNGDGVNDTAERNLLSGDSFAGILIYGQGTDGNAVAGNLIGTTVTGDVTLDNGTSPYQYDGGTLGGGVVIGGGASANRIGTDGESVDGAGQRNVIAGSDNDGVDIVGAGTDGNIVAGNFIGTASTGTRALGIAGDGVFLADGASFNWIGVNPNGGMAVAEEGNVISGNGYDGVQISSGSNSNVVAGNKIGTDAAGAIALGNAQNGVEIDSGAASNTIGGATPGAGDVISANGKYGVWITGAGATGDVVQGNLIGTDITGTVALGNVQSGVRLDSGASSNTIGGVTADAGNLITENGGPGVVVGASASDITSIGNQITANRIFGNKGQAIDLGDDGVTENGAAPRQGPNNLQNFPIILTTADSQTEGLLGGGTPNTTFRVDLFASAGYGPGGSGEAQNYLGSLEVTTDASGQVSFPVPFTAPAGLPIITATATHPEGNTSEVSSPLSGGFRAQSEVVRLSPGQESLAFSPASGDAIDLQDSAAGSSGLTFELTLFVSAGTLTLSSTAGLVGSGDETGSLSYSGALSALNAGLDGMTYAPPAGFEGNASLSVEAQSDGVVLLAGQVLITTRSFVVTTTADSGPGSLRQGILDSNAATGGSNTIDFAIPGTGAQTIALGSPLPPITASVLFDGTTQQGFAGAPLIELGAPAGGAGLTIAAPDVTVRGLVVHQFSFDPTADEVLVAQVHPQGVTTHLSLLDSQGQVLVQSDGLSPSDPDDLIAQHLAGGTYFLKVESAAGAGMYTLTTTVAPTTAPFQPLPVGSYPDAIVAGDFTGDGHLDLAVANSGGTVSVLLGNGDGTFQPQVTYAVGFLPVAIVAGDFTGDGDLDLAVANSEVNTVSVLLGNGDGTFQSATTIALPAGGEPKAIAAGNFTGSGYTDLAVADAGTNNVAILQNDGTGNFRVLETIPVGSDPDALAAGDFENDGRLDLGVANANPSSVTILSNRGGGVFQPLATISLPQLFSTASAIVAGNFGTGQIDLAVADSSLNEVDILLGRGNGTFQLSSSFEVGLDPAAIVAGDFNGDGRTDLGVANNNSDDVSILLGNGDGTFQPKVTYAVGSNPRVIVAGRFDTDGHLDLAVANYLDNTVSVLLGNGDGTFQPQSEAQDAAGSDPGAIVAGDFTGDGRTDLAVANEYSDEISILWGNGDGTFEPPVEYPVGAGPDSIVAGDFNGDGRTDLAVANLRSDDVSVLLGNGDGTFQPQVTYPAGTNPYAIVAADFNGDGHLDLAVAGEVLGSGGTVSVLLGNGDGTFRPPVTYAVGEDPDAIVAADFNGDGHLDLAVANEDLIGSGGTVSVLLGNGDGTFRPQVTYPVGKFPDAIVAGDFNGDGHLDLAVANPSFSISVLLGNGDGTFQPQVTYAVGSDPVAIVAGDFSGDGHLDLAAANSGGNTVSVLLGNGDGKFQPQVTYAVGSEPSAIASGDFNGRTGLATTNFRDNDVSILLGNGDGSFVDAGQFDTTGSATPLVADVNGDGTDDVLVVDGDGEILYRQGVPGQPGTFEPPVTVNSPLPDGSNPYTSRDIAWLPNTDQGPVLASVDAKDNDISFYAYRDGGFVRMSGSLATGPLPAQIIAAALNMDGLTDLVVRNAGDGTLSVYLGSPLVGPITSLDSPNFTAPLTIPVGLGVSDVKAVDTTGSDELDLVVTNELTGQVSILRNLGDGSFAAPVPYSAGTGLSAIDPGNLPEVASLEATAGVAAGPLTPGGSTDLVTVNPGSDTIDVLTGLGGGRFANPVALLTQGPAQVVRIADFTGNGIDDLATLTSAGVSIYLGNGSGGFLPPAPPYPVPPESDGLTVTDLTGSGKLDLLVGDAYGDVLVLLGNGDGTFEPYHDSNQQVELAVANLTGKGSKDIIYADQSLDRVVVDYGGGNSKPIATQSQGLLDPGAVQLANLAGPDYPPDLIVANSGSNNVLIYPGLGNGQFGPAINGGHGYFVGTNPVGITVAKLTGALPDLVVADKGSNQVSILVNNSQGGDISFSAGPRLDSGGYGPVSTVVGNFSGGPYPDILVTNSASNDVALLQGVGGGFFNDTSLQKFPVGNDPGPTFVGPFNGQTDLLTVNSGSNDLTLVSGFEDSNAVTSTIASGGVDPATAFDFTGPGGFEDLVVGNSGDGALALFEGGTTGLTLTSTEVVANLPDPTALAFSALSGGQLQFYAATAGREAATFVTLSVSGETLAGSLALASLTSTSNVAQLVPISEQSLALVATLLTVTIESSPSDLSLESAEAFAVSPGASVSLGQGLSAQNDLDRAGEGEAENAGQAADDATHAASAQNAAWERFMLGLDEAFKRFRREHPQGISRESDRSDRPVPSPAPTSPVRDGPTSLRSAPGQLPPRGGRDVRAGSISTLTVKILDAIIQSVWGEDDASDHSSSSLSFSPLSAVRIKPVIDRVSLPLVAATMAASWAFVARSHTRWTASYPARRSALTRCGLRNRGFGYQIPDPNLRDGCYSTSEECEVD